MVEDVQIMQLNIEHYQKLITLDRYTPETRQRAKELLSETQARLRGAKATLSHEHLYFTQALDGALLLGAPQAKEQVGS